MIKENKFEKLFKKRTRFTLSIYAISILFVFYIVFTGFTLYRQVSENEQQRLSLLATQLKNLTDNYFENYISNFVILSKLMAVREKQTTRLNELFRLLNRQFYEFENIAAVDENGNFFASGKSFDIVNPPNVSELSFFTKLKKSKKRTIIMEPHIGPISHREVTGVVIRLDDDDQNFKGVLGTSIRLSHLTDKWQKFANDHDVYLFCYQENKNILFSNAMESSLISFFSGRTVKKIYENGDRKFLYTKTIFPELSLNVVILSEKDISILGSFFSNYLNLVVVGLFVFIIGMLLFLHQEEMVWIKLLIQRETLLDDVQRISRVGGWEWDIKKQSMTWTDEMYRIYGFATDENKMTAPLSIENMGDCYSSKDHSIIMEAFADCVKKGKAYSLELPLTTGSGDLKWILTTAKPFMKNGEITKIIGNVMDVSDRKQAEETWKENADKFRSVFENSPLGFVHLDKLGVITACNDNLCEILGSKKEEIIGFNAIESLQDEKMLNAIVKALSGKKSRYEGEYLSMTGDIRTQVRVQCAPIISDVGDVNGVICVFEDITEQLSAEKDKLQLEAQLRQLQKMEAIGALAGGIAHDFNNILFPIVGFAEMLEEDLAGDKELSENVREILSGARRAKDLVKQILTFSRQAEQDIKPLQPHLIIKEVAKLIRSTIPTSIEIKNYIDPKTGTIMADPTQIHQVAMNLLTNAYHAMQETGGVLTIRLENIQSSKIPRHNINIGDGPHVLFSVKDTGIGMEKNTLERIFDPYFTTKPKGKGTGLGLSVVHGIVINYGGDISVTSSLGKGTRFDVYLPAFKTEMDSKLPGSMEVVPKGNERILLVDDEEQVLRIEQVILKRLGYRVETMHSSIDALEAVKANPDSYDLVISDMTMPHMTGDQLAVKILEIKSTLPIVICTGFSESISLENVKAIGVKALLMKPIIKSKLAKTVRNVLDENIKCQKF